ncbi:MAG TPA: prepilin-type N-terminal cleavage/methylation domain-containing protein [bacterium]|nr:prepilin-type N-terminal cleavage/methylation domain-containing protein [bacterium]
MVSQREGFGVVIARTAGASDGFSLLEIIVALALVAAAIAIAWPIFNSSPTALAADVQDLQNNLQLTRELATSRSLHYHLKATVASQYLIERCTAFGSSCTAWATERTISLRPNIVFDALTIGTAAEFNTRGYLAAPATAVTFTLHDTRHGNTLSTHWTKLVTVNPVGMVDKQ